MLNNNAQHELHGKGDNFAPKKQEITPKQLLDAVKSKSEAVCAPVKHKEILNRLLAQIKPVDFKELAYPDLPDTERKERKISQNDHVVMVVEQIMNLAKANDWAICFHNGAIYLFNGAFWNQVNDSEFRIFLGAAAEKLGVRVLTAKFHQFRDNLFKQFCTNLIQAQEPEKDKALINLLNGTFEVRSEGFSGRPFNAADFITYQLPFSYNPAASCPKFDAFLNFCLPEKDKQLVIAEYLGYCLIKNGHGPKLEKVLLLYGSGANGKSVIFEVVSALFGGNNVSNVELSTLTGERNHDFRAVLGDKLLNYGSEIGKGIGSEYLKKLVSGEPIQVSKKYINSYTMVNYAKLMFNCNSLPADVEFTEGYFRRFLIIPFEVTIPEENQNRYLHQEIIQTEMPGVLNWVLNGLLRIIKQGKFTYCEAAANLQNKYRAESDSIHWFITDNDYQPHESLFVPIKELLAGYQSYCRQNNMHPVSRGKFIERLKRLNIKVGEYRKKDVAFITIVPNSGY